MDDLHARGSYGARAACRLPVAGYDPCDMAKRRAAHLVASPVPPPARRRSSGWSIARSQRSPKPYRVALEEVAIVIEDEPSREQLRENGIEPGDSLYGLYEGVSRAEYGADWAAEPNRITLFRLPLEEDFPDPAELEDEVRLTVLHELAHHLGIDDDRLEELGAG